MGEIPPGVVEPLASLPHPEVIQPRQNRTEQKLEAQRQVRNPPVIFAPDFHNTYVMVVKDQEGVDPAVTKARREHFTQATIELRDLLEANSVPVVPITAVDLGEIVGDMENIYHQTGTMAQFTSIFVANGTELINIEIDREGNITYVPDAEYNELIEGDRPGQKRFKRDAVYTACVTMRNAFVDETRDEGTEIPPTHPDWNMVFQTRDREENVASWADYDRRIADGEQDIPTPPGKRPQPHKISYDIDVPIGTTAGEIQAAMKEQLMAAGFPDIHVVPSLADNAPEGRVKFWVDVIPMTKGDAIRYLRSRYSALVYSAGDSKNDIYSLAEAGGVVAGAPAGHPAHAELIEKVEALPGFTRRPRSRFATFEDPESRSTQILYLEPGDKQGPETIERAVRAYQLWEIIQKNKQASSSSPASS